MKRVRRSMSRLAKKATVTVYRASRGRLLNTAPGGMSILLLTVTGRRSGKHYTVPVGYVPRDGGWVVVGSGGGGDVAEPQWFRNLRASDRAVVEKGDQRHDVSVRILEGPERDAAFRDVVAVAPGFGTYEKQAGRRMPLALLTPR